MVRVIFILPNGEEKKLEVPEGMTLLEVAHGNNLPLEGACEGSLACSTCHLIIDKQWFNSLETPSEAEEDMLDLAFGLTPFSRLGCQIVLTQKLDGLRVTIPESSCNVMLG